MNGYDRIENGADPVNGERGNIELPAVGQLHGNDVAATDAKMKQRGGGPFDVGGQAGVRQVMSLVRVVPIADDSRFTRIIATYPEEIIDDGLASPPAIFVIEPPALLRNGQRETIQHIASRSGDGRYVDTVS